MKRPQRPPDGWRWAIFTVVLTILVAGPIWFFIIANLIASAMGFGPPVE